VLNHLPDAKLYNPDGMKSDDRETFLEWYTEHTNGSIPSSPTSDEVIAIKSSRNFKQHRLRISTSDRHQTSVLSHLPDTKFYNPDGMKSDDRETFLEWYTEHKKDTFDFQQELSGYEMSHILGNYDIES
jgi:hypothetical protein